jgi:TRAP-type C4-dicarboxylate transport system substrate-binding protein
MYPGATLYSSVDAITALQSGDLEMAFYGVMTAFLIPEWSLISAGPSLFLFNDISHFKRFQDTDAYNRLLTRMEDMGIKPLTKAYLWGPEQIFNNKRPIAKHEDFQGLKLSVEAIPAAIEAISTLGGTAVQIPVPELPASLETGMADGLTVGFVAQMWMPLNKLFPYVTIVDAPCYPTGVAVSTKWWNTVPSDLQQKLQPLFEDAMAGWEPESSAACDEQFAIYKDTPGTTVTVMSDEEKARCREVLQPLYDKLSSEDQNVQDMMEAVEATR